MEKIALDSFFKFHNHLHRYNRKNMSHSTCLKSTSVLIYLPHNMNPISNSKIFKAQNLENTKGLQRPDYSSNLLRSGSK